ncbi:hypothetical protein GCM10007100_24690 [Roseibacillus persicicus]|uniref:Transposase IS200-like domain-containing protein n=1 Tax=Roseibacillus persicicus TaxID=454148 RepID=A0A918TPL4_9BACT|nr:hypothetical protein GCM10007100_24690 [Roseibacillus persicicus]
MANAFRHFDEKRYLIDSFIVMPNHVHILFSLFENESISQVIHSWKRFSAREINKRNKTTGSLWQPEYWDRLIRNHDHFLWARSYIERNPKKLPPQTYKIYQRP